MDTKKTLILSAILFLLTIQIPIPPTCAAGETWKKIFTAAIGDVSCMDAVNGTDKLFVGTKNGVFRSVDMGRTWEMMDLPGGVSDIRGIVNAENGIFLATGNGLYVNRTGDEWQLLPGRKDIRGVTFGYDEDGSGIVLAWSTGEIFRIGGEGRDRVGYGSLRDTIDDVVLREGIIFAASGRDIFRLPGRDGTWEKISLFKGSGRGEEEENTLEGEEEQEEGNILCKLDPNGPEGVTAATVNGIFIIRDEGISWKRVDTTGLPSGDVTFAADSEKGLFAATDKKIFLYSGDEKRWLTFFETTDPGVISFLREHRDSKGRNWILAACGGYVYRRNIDLLSFENQDTVMTERGGSEAGEPSVNEVHRMAIEYAEVSPEKIRRWRTGAKWKALLPRVSLGFSESLNDNIEIYKNSTMAYIVEAPREVDNDWGVDLTWDLSDLIWNGSQTAIDVRSKLMVQLRDDILEEVTRLYFERKRLLAEIAVVEKRGCNGIDEVKREGRKNLFEKKIRAEELTAYIDALTGGEFSRTCGELRDQPDGTKETMNRARNKIQVTRYKQETMTRNQ